MSSKQYFSNSRLRPYGRNVLGILFAIILTFPLLCQSHSNEKPSFKYSREANENFRTEEFHEHESFKNQRQHHKYDDHVHNHQHDHNYVRVSTLDLNSVWMYSMGSTLLISAAPFLLLFFIPLDSSDTSRPRLKVLLAFAAGGLLGDAFLHLIPHAIHFHIPDRDHHAHDDVHNHHVDTIIGICVLGGIITFLAVEKLVRLLKGGGHNHNHNQTIHLEIKNVDKKNNLINGKKNIVYNKTSHKNTRTVDISGYLNLAADFAHNFTDGLAIGASYLAGSGIGLITTVTILLHEVPHEIGDFAILIKSGCSRRQAIMLQLVTAIGALAGNALALFGVGASSEAVPWVLPFTAGGFIYIATVSVLPELLEDSTKFLQSIKEISALLAGVILMVFIANFE